MPALGEISDHRTSSAFPSLSIFFKKMSDTGKSDCQFCLNSEERPREYRSGARVRHEQGFSSRYRC